MLRLIHTADWHLGHSLHGVSREFEHDRFLCWLLDRLEQTSADALIVAGDVFDSANPPASAQSALFSFLRNAKRRMPDLDVLLVAGNHDSGSRLTAPAPLLNAFGVHVIGGLPRTESQLVDWSSLCVPLHTAAGRVAAWCGAMPFLRNPDLPTIDPESGDPLVLGVQRRYQQLLEALIERSADKLPLIMTGHCYMTGARLSELSERRILGGNQHALPVDLFPPEIGYAALGHLHLAQVVAGQETRRYSGSPIPLALNERRYRHQVLQVDIASTGEVAVSPLLVPRQVEMLRVPATGAASVDALVEALRALDLDEGLPPEAYPFLEVCVYLDRPQPGLRQQLDEVLAGRPVRLLKVTASYAGSREPLAALEVAAQLDSLAPEAVFKRRYAQLYSDEPPQELIEAFHTLVEAAQQVD